MPQTKKIYSHFVIFHQKKKKNSCMQFEQSHLFLLRHIQATLPAVCSKLPSEYYRFIGMPGVKGFQTFTSVNDKIFLCTDRIHKKKVRSGGHSSLSHWWLQVMSLKKENRCWSTICTVHVKLSSKNYKLIFITYLLQTPESLPKCSKPGTQKHPKLNHWYPLCASQTSINTNTHP